MVFGSIAEMKSFAQGEEDNTANERLSEGANWLRVVHEGAGKFSFFHDKNGKTRILTEAEATFLRLSAAIAGDTDA